VRSVSGGTDLTVDVLDWLRRRPDLRRPFVDGYRPRHRADPADLADPAAAV